MILSQEVQRFIDEIKTLNEVGCITVPTHSLETLTEALDQSELIIGSTPQPHRVTYYKVDPENTFPEIQPPAMLVVTEEDYSSDENWQERVRNVAAYFLNVK